VLLARTEPGSGSSGSSVDQELCDHELALQLEALVPTPAVAAPAHVQLQLDAANPALCAPVAVLQLEALQLEAA
jgi:hypothetical protein